MTTLETMDFQAFRKKLAGIADPSKRPSGGAVAQAVKDDAIRLCSILAHLFGESLDRKTLWSRIDSAFATAVAKVSDADVDRFISLCLEHVQADPGHAAACQPLGQMLAQYATRPPELRQDFVNYCGTHRFAVLSHGRARWEQIKTKAVEL